MLYSFATHGCLLGGGSKVQIEEIGKHFCVGAAGYASSCVTFKTVLCGLNGKYRGLHALGFNGLDRRVTPQANVPGSYCCVLLYQSCVGVCSGWVRWSPRPPPLPYTWSCWMLLAHPPGWLGMCSSWCSSRSRSSRSTGSSSSNAAQQCRQSSQLAATGATMKAATAGQSLMARQVASSSQMRTKLMWIPYWPRLLRRCVWPASMNFDWLGLVCWAPVLDDVAARQHNNICMPTASFHQQHMAAACSYIEPRRRDAIQICVHAHHAPVTWLHDTRIQTARSPGYDLPTYHLVCLQVEARHKGGKKHRKHRSKSSKADSSSEPQRLGSPGKAHKHTVQTGQQHSSTEIAPAGDEQQEQQQRGRSSTASNQIVLSDPAAAFVLVATQEFVRVYSVTHAVNADRTTMRKVAMQGTLQFASAFMACGSPALACLLELDGEIHLQVSAGGPLHSRSVWPAFC